MHEYTYTYSLYSLHITHENAQRAGIQNDLVVIMIKSSNISINIVPLAKWLLLTPWSSQYHKKYTQLAFNYWNEITFVGRWKQKELQYHYRVYIFFIWKWPNLIQ